MEICEEFDMDDISEATKDSEDPVNDDNKVPLFLVFDENVITDSTPRKGDNALNDNNNQVKPVKKTASKRPRHDVNERRYLLAQAVKAVQEEKISMRKASQRFNLAKSSLCDYVRKNNIILPNIRVKSYNGSPGNQNNGATGPPKLTPSTALIIKSETVNGSNNGSKTPPSLISFDHQPRKKINACNITTAALPPNSMKGPRPIAPKTQRIESPWSSSTGLPTQVPISSWGVLSSTTSDTKLKPLVLLQDSTEAATTGNNECKTPLSSIDWTETGNASVNGVNQTKILIEDETEVLNDSLSFDSNLSSSGLSEFINKCPTPFHVIANVRKSLLDVGYKEIAEDEPWMIQTSSKVFFIRDQTEIVAIAVGGHYKPGSGFTILGAYNDSPCLKLKSLSMVNKGISQPLQAIPFGHSDWSTWCDRDLSVAGRCIVKANGYMEHRLVFIQNSLLQINTAKGPSNQSQTIFYPTFCNQTSPEISPDESADILLRMIADELSVELEDIMDLELALIPTNSNKTDNLTNGDLTCPRLDNLANIFAATQALASSNESILAESNVRVVYFFSRSNPNHFSGMDWISSLRETVLGRLTATLHATELTNCGAWGRSQVADLQASAVARSCFLCLIPTCLSEKKPNQNGKKEVDYNQENDHDNNEKNSLKIDCSIPELDKDEGLVLRLEAGNITAPIIKEIANIVDVPLQDYVIETDTSSTFSMSLGSPIKEGPTVIQVGPVVHNFHQMFEKVSNKDVLHAINLYKGFLENYPHTYSGIKYIYD